MLKSQSFSFRRFIFSHQRQRLKFDAAALPFLLVPLPYFQNRIRPRKVYNTYSIRRSYGESIYVSAILLLARVLHCTLEPKKRKEKKVAQPFPRTRTCVRFHVQTRAPFHVKKSLSLFSFQLILLKSYREREREREKPAESRNVYTSCD